MVGLLFALGHSSVVILTVVFLIVLSSAFSDLFDQIGSIGGLISGIFIACVYFFRYEWNVAFQIISGIQNNM
jgi:high-affinity nickel permease